MTFAAVLVCFLLPFVSVSCPGAKVSLSGLQLVQGATIQVPQTFGPAEARLLPPNALAQAAAACAALGLLLSLITGASTRLPSMLTGATGAVLLLLLKSRLEGQAGSQGMEMASFNVETPFWLAVVGLGGIAVLSWLQKPAVKVETAGSSAPP